ncbi:hypothetical protein GCM10007053_26110 [Halioglobus pacificus]|uniref:Uncharacterized protein n=1 Tax=Parahalioglobus pacificus TaxID=930806 RepID=A0A918XKV5_9GAMM|nr:hypothetical protein GCM10007053_26110 [Halioglobus pacificus]
MSSVNPLQITVALSGAIQPDMLVSSGTGDDGNYAGAWLGMSRAVSVTATAKRSGTRGVALRVKQQVTIERVHQ